MNIAQCTPCKNTLVLTTKLVHLKYPEYNEGVNITQSATQSILIKHLHKPCWFKIGLITEMFHVMVMNCIFKIHHHSTWNMWIFFEQLCHWTEICTISLFTYRKRVSFLQLCDTIWENIIIVHVYIVIHTCKKKNKPVVDNRFNSQLGCMLKYLQYLNFASCKSISLLN